MATGNETLKKRGNYTYRGYMKKDIKNVNFEDFTNPWTFAALFMSEDMKLVKWLMDRNILASSMKCVCCGLNCKLSKEQKNLAQPGDVKVIKTTKHLCDGIHS